MLLYKTNKSRSISNAQFSFYFFRVRNKIRRVNCTHRDEKISILIIETRNSFALTLSLLIKENEEVNR